MELVEGTVTRLGLVEGKGTPLGLVEGKECVSKQRRNRTTFTTYQLHCF